MQPRKVQLRGEVRREVRIDPRLRKQEDGQVRRLFRTQGEAKGYCNRPESNLRNYTDKAWGLSDAQKMESREPFALPSAVPGATLGKRLVPGTRFTMQAPAASPSA